MRHARGLVSVFGVLLLVSACSPASPPKATPSTGSSPTATAVSQESISAADAFLASITSQELFSGSVLISQHGHVLLSKGYGFADRAKKTPNSPQARFAIGSITKQFTAAAILLLQVQGKLKVSDLICTYVPQCPSAWGVVTIKELLSHASGISNDALPASVDAGPPLTPAQIIAQIRDVPLDSAPGTTWAYSNSGYLVLGYIIEQVSGLSYEAFLQKNILTPLNLNDTGYNHNSNGVVAGYVDGSATPIQPDPSWLTYSAGSLYSTVEDMNRWEQALTTDALLPAASRAEMFATQMAISDGQLPPNVGPMAVGYGYGFFIGTDSGRPIVWHDGVVAGFTTLEARYPVDDVTIILLGNQMVNVETILPPLSAKVLNAK